MEKCQNCKGVMEEDASVSCLCNESLCVRCCECEETCGCECRDK